MILRPRPHLVHPVVIHLEHCDCVACTPSAPGDRRALSLSETAAWGLAGLVTGNAVAFIAAPHAAWAALAAAAAHLLGLAR